MKNNTALARQGRDEFLTPFSYLFDRIITDSFPDFSKEFGISFFGNNSRPKVDIKEYEDKIQIIAEVAGLSKDEVNVEVKEGVITITGEKKEKISKTDETYLHVELSQSKFSRSFELGNMLDSKNINAQFNNGLLTIDIPKIEPKKVESYKIEIK